MQSRKKMQVPIPKELGLGSPTQANEPDPTGEQYFVMSFWTRAQPQFFRFEVPASNQSQYGCGVR